MFSTFPQTPQPTGRIEIGSAMQTRTPYASLQPGMDPLGHVPTAAVPPRVQFQPDLSADLEAGEPHMMSYHVGKMWKSEPRDQHMKGANPRRSYLPCLWHRTHTELSAKCRHPVISMSMHWNKRSPHLPHVFPLKSRASPVAVMF